MTQVGGKTGATHTLVKRAVIRRVFWSRRLCKPGEKAIIQILCSNVPDGTKVKVELVPQGIIPHLKAKNPPTTGTVQKNCCDIEWTAGLENVPEGKMPIVLIGVKVSIPDLAGVEGRGMNYLAVAEFGAVIQRVDPSFCPGHEKLEIEYSILDPSKFVRSGILRVYGNQYEKVSYPEEKAIVHQQLLTPQQLTSGTHILKWEGHTNAKAGPLKPPDAKTICYVNPLFSPYVVDIQLLDQPCKEVGQWKQDKALLSCPHPDAYKGTGLKAVGDAAELPPDDASRKYSAFEIAVEKMEISLGSYVADPTASLGDTAKYQLRLNELGYFCGPVDDTDGDLTKLGVGQYKRNHWEVEDDPIKAGQKKVNPEKPLGDRDTLKVDSTLDAKAKATIDAESKARVWMEFLEDDGSLKKDDQDKPIVNKLPLEGQKARIILDGTTPYQKGSEFWNNATGRADITKQEREKQWIPRPWIPLESHCLLRKRDGKAGTAEQSRLGCMGMKVLWRATDPKEDHIGLGFPAAPFTGLNYTEHTVAAVTLPAINTVKGWKWRMFRLGYDVGTLNDNKDAKAIAGAKKFQGDNGLSRDGNVGFWTRRKLKKKHGNGSNESIYDILLKYKLKDKKILLDDPVNKAFKDANPDLQSLTLSAKVKIPPFPNFVKYKKHKEGQPEDFNNKVVKSYAGKTDGDWIADNAPDVDKNSKKIYGSRTFKETKRGSDALRHDDKLLALEPWTAVEVDDNRAKKGKAIATVTAVKGPRKGKAGLYFVPSRIGGDSYVVESWIDLKKDDKDKAHSNAKWLEKKYAKALPIGKTGRMTVWKRFTFAEFLFIKDRRLSPTLPQIDWKRFQEMFRRAYMDIELPPEKNGREMTEAEYKAIVAEGFSVNAANVTLDREEFYARVPLGIPAQNNGEDPNAYIARVKTEKQGDFHSKFAKAAGLQLRKRHRTGAIIVDFRRNMKAFPVKFTDGSLIPTATITQHLENDYLASGQSKGCLCLDQRDTDKAAYVWAHELGHSLFMYHWYTHNGAEENNLKDHDNDDDYCIMMYAGPGEATKIDPDFCGKCLLKLRGWNEKPLPKKGPGGGSGPSSAKAGGAAMQASEDLHRFVSVLLHSNRYKGSCKLIPAGGAGSEYTSEPIQKAGKLWAAAFRETDIQPGAYFLECTLKDDRVIRQHVNVDHVVRKVSGLQDKDGMLQLVGAKGMDKEVALEPLVGDGYSLEEAFLRMFDYYYADGLSLLLSKKQPAELNIEDPVQASWSDERFATYIGVTKTLHERSAAAIGWIKGDFQFLKSYEKLKTIYKNLSSWGAMAEAVEELELPVEPDLGFSWKKWTEAVDGATKPVEVMGKALEVYSYLESTAGLFEASLAADNADQIFSEEMRNFHDARKQLKAPGDGSWFSRSELIQAESLKQTADHLAGEMHAKGIEWTREMVGMALGLLFPAGYLATAFGKAGETIDSAMGLISDAIDAFDGWAFDNYFSNRARDLLESFRDECSRAHNDNSILYLLVGRTQQSKASTEYLLAFCYRAKILYGLKSLIGDCGSPESDPKEFRAEVSRNHLDTYIEKFIFGGPFWVRKDMLWEDWLRHLHMEEDKKVRADFLRFGSKPADGNGPGWEKIDFQKWFPIHFQEHSSAHEFARTFSTDYSGIAESDVETTFLQVASSVEINKAGATEVKAWRNLEKNEVIDSETPVRGVLILTAASTARLGIPATMQIYRVDGWNVDGPTYKTVLRKIAPLDQLPEYLDRKGLVVDFSYAYARIPWGAKHTVEPAKVYRGIKPMKGWLHSAIVQDMKMAVWYTLGRNEAQDWMQNDEELTLRWAHVGCMPEDSQWQQRNSDKFSDADFLHRETSGEKFKFEVDKDLVKIHLQAKSGGSWKTLGGSDSVEVEQPVRAVIVVEKPSDVKRPKGMPPCPENTPASVQLIRTDGWPFPNAEYNVEGPIYRSGKMQKLDAHGFDGWGTVIDLWYYFIEDIQEGNSKRVTVKKLEGIKPVHRDLGAEEDSYDGFKFDLVVTVGDSWSNPKMGEPDDIPLKFTAAQKTHYLDRSMRFTSSHLRPKIKAIVSVVGHGGTMLGGGYSAFYETLKPLIKSGSVHADVCNENDSK